MERETYLTNRIKRIYSEKKNDFALESEELRKDLSTALCIDKLISVRILNRYDVENITETEFDLAAKIVFSDATVDNVYLRQFPIDPTDRVFAIEYLPGQYDQRADWAAQCVQILTQREKPIIRSAKIIILKGNLSDEDFIKIKDYCINRVEAREASLCIPESLILETPVPEDISCLTGFISMNDNEIKNLLMDLELSMSYDDLLVCRNYFRDVENRNPTITEIRVLDTYWSDHCRHTTFLTNLEKIEFESSPNVKPIYDAFLKYMESRNFVYNTAIKPITFMDLATIVSKEMNKKNMLPDLDLSEEVNAAGIIVPVKTRESNQDYVVMFKNETHNHPTEIEPFGGAATCLGGAIRDPLSGRAFVYQAMRVSGSGDPRVDVSSTLKGKLPQKKITTGAAAGFSAYGNQVGLATGLVLEIYDEGYVAKRMEIGAVIAAVPKENVKRSRPQAGDMVLLLGGKTGRDGCGGATGSSKPHTEDSLNTCSAEVQKGNPVEERKMQRLFRNPIVSSMIKKCNDFGAGGVSVAVGELADGLDVNLDAIPVKYDGLDGTELAISESQERMAVVISKCDVQNFIREAAKENLEATVIASVTQAKRLVMRWRGNTIVNISRDFLNSNGATKYADVRVPAPDMVSSPFSKSNFDKSDCQIDFRFHWLKNLSNLNVCSLNGLAERFDSSVGANSVLMPFGGKYQLTPVDGMVAKIPVLHSETSTCSIMTCGYNPTFANWSPYHTGVYSVVEAVSKAVVLGGDVRKIRLSFQEYFERLDNDPVKWGKVFACLLGAFQAQTDFGIPAIGGKDSMSGSFNDLTVPPTLVSFAVVTADASKIVSPEFKNSDRDVVLLSVNKDENELPDIKKLLLIYEKVHKLICSGKIVSASAVKFGGIAETISKMCFGNMIGFEFSQSFCLKDCFMPGYGSVILEIAENYPLETLFGDIDYAFIGKTSKSKNISATNICLSLSEVLEVWQEPLEKIFSTKTVLNNTNLPNVYSYNARLLETSVNKIAKPKVLIPVFPGTNCEYETAYAFEKAGAIVDVVIFNNMTVNAISDSLINLEKKIGSVEIICLPGGFSAGDEPDGSGKFISAVFRNTRIKDSIEAFFDKRDGLMIGICNGFQALVKLGLLPFGKIVDLNANSSTLTYNLIGRHVSRMVKTRVASVKSPWLQNLNIGDVHVVAVSHGEGRFIANVGDVELMAKQGQIAFQYVDENDHPTYKMPWNPNGSVEAIEGIISPDGRILGKMGHSERSGLHISKNIPGNKNQCIFEAGIQYFNKL